MSVGAISSQLGREEFLKLLVTKLKNQDPLNPIEDQDFVGQLAQLSTLEGIEKLNVSFADMMSLQTITQGANLIGKTVLYTPSSGGATQEGVVSGFTLQGGALQLQVGSSLVPISQVQGMKA